MNVEIKKVNEKAVIPTRGSAGAAGYDLYACIDEPVEVLPHTTVKIGTGLAMKLPEGYFGGIFARSGIATKRALRPSNCCGIIDEDFRGECIVALHNDSPVTQTILPNERIAQLLLLPYMPIEFTEVETLSETGRGDGGFGSSGHF
jgi:dUTP pyrophosphatase